MKVFNGKNGRVVVEYDSLEKAGLHPDTKLERINELSDGYHTFDELYEPELDNDGNIKYGWNNQIQYTVKNNEKDPKYKWDRNFVTEENKSDIISRLTKNNNLWFMFSIDENPNWEKQEELMNIGQRIHLG